jgi:hypothetical protein
MVCKRTLRGPEELLKNELPSGRCSLSETPILARATQPRTLALGRWMALTRDKCERSRSRRRYGGSQNQEWKSLLRKNAARTLKHPTGGRSVVGCTAQWGAWRRLRGVGNIRKGFVLELWEWWTSRSGTPSFPQPLFLTRDECR